MSALSTAPQEGAVSALQTAPQEGTALSSPEGIGAMPATQWFSNRPAGSGKGLGQRTVQKGQEQRTVQKARGRELFKRARGRELWRRARGRELCRRPAKGVGSESPGK